MNNKIIEALKNQRSIHRQAPPSGMMITSPDKCLRRIWIRTSRAPAGSFYLLKNQQHGSAILYRHLIIHSFLISAAAPAFMLKDLPGQAIRLLAWIFKTFH